MAGARTHRDNEPLGYIGRFPVFAATILVSVYLLGACLSGVFFARHTGSFLVPFDPEVAFKMGKWWSVFTYSLVNDFSIFTLLGLLLLYRGAVEVEKFYGRRHILRLFLVLALAPPIISTIFWLLGADSRNVALIGSATLSIAFFVAFASVYPNIEFFGTVTPKTIAIFLVALSAVLLAASKNQFGILILLTSSAIAFAYIMKVRNGGEVEFGKLFRGFSIPRPTRKPRLVVLPPPQREIPRAEMAENPEDSEVDALLDKIAKSGLASLSAGERARLEKAREELLKKERQ